MLLVLLVMASVDAETRTLALDNRDRVCRTAQAVHNTFYFDLGTTNPALRLGVLRFVLASTSPVVNIQRTAGVQVGRRLLRVDLRDLGAGYQKHFAAEIIKQYPYSPHRLPLIVRADWWIQHVMDETRSGQLYYKLLTGDVVKSKIQFFKAFGVAEKSLYEFGTITRESGVSVTGVRLITTLPDDHRSSLWQTYDSANLNPETDPLGNLVKLPDFDAQEIIATIPKNDPRNGNYGTLQVYGLFNSAGELQFKAPADTVTDSTKVRGVEVIAPVSCISCHTSGLNPLGDNALVTYLQSGAEAFAKIEDLDRIETKYLTDLANIVIRNNEDYERIIRAVTGWSPAELSSNLRDEIVTYHQDITLGGVARELGVTVAHLQKSLAGEGLVSPRSAQLANDGVIPRTILEAEFRQLGEICESY